MTKRSGMLGLTGLAAVLAGSMFLATGSVAAPPSATTKAAEDAARLLLADRFLNDARSAARNASIPAELAAREVLLLMQVARLANPDSPEVLDALCEAAQAAKQRELYKDALKNLIRVDPGNLVAQVEYLDLLARSSQEVEQQIRIYSAAVDKKELDPQVRSELALRLARLHLQRGTADEARKRLDQAVALNDVNPGAWEELVRIGTAGHLQDRMPTIVSCLLANPYQPAVWLQGARVLESSNQHDLAAQWLMVAIEQGSRQGVTPPADLVQEWALEAATADRRADAEPVLKNLAGLEDAPTPTLLTALSVIGPSLTTTAPDQDPLVQKIRDRMAASVKARPEDKDVLADAAWIELFYMPTPGEQTEGYLKTLEAKLGAKDDLYQRLAGWKLLRDGKFAEAAGLLQPLVAKDPLAGLGMARIYAAQKNTQALTAQLQDLWNGHPTGLLALHVATEARKDKIALKDTAVGQAVRGAAAGLPRAFLTSYAQPRDLDLISPTMAKRRYPYAEPIVLAVKITNTTDRPLSVGPNAAIKPSLALSASTRGLSAQNLGSYAYDNTHRVYRLEKRATLSQNLRVDQGPMSDVLFGNPMSSQGFSITLIQDPREGPKGVVPGLGGQSVYAGDFVRDPVAISKPEDVERIVRDLPSAGMDRQMVDGLVLMHVLEGLPPEAAGGGGNASPPAGSQPAVTPETLRTDITQTLVKVLQSDSPILKAWFLRHAPLRGMPKAFEEVLGHAAESDNSVVRLTGVWRSYMLQKAAATDANAFLAKFKEQLAGEKDPLAAAWGDVLIKVATTPAPTRPATSPTTSPATAPPTTPPAEKPEKLEK